MISAEEICAPPGGEGRAGGTGLENDREDRGDPPVQKAAAPEPPAQPAEAAECPPPPRRETARVKKPVSPPARVKNPAKKTEPKPVDVPSEAANSSGKSPEASSERENAGHGGSAQVLASLGASGGGSGGAGHAGAGHRSGGGGGIIDARFGDYNGPRFKRQVKPKYPDLARRLGKEGTVLLRIIIDEDGRAVAVEVLGRVGSGFDEEAVRAVRESTFVPAVSQGRPVKSRAVLPVRFELKGPA